MKKILVVFGVVLLQFNSNAQNQKYLVTDVEEGITYKTGNVAFQAGGGIKFEADTRQIGGPNLMALLNSEAPNHIAGISGVKVSTGPKEKIIMGNPADPTGEGEVAWIFCLNQNNWPCALSIATKH